MSKPSRKKQQRRDKRKKSNLVRRKRFASRQSAAQQFPQIELELGDAPPPLANAVRQAVRRIQFENERLFPPDTLAVLQIARKIGFSGVRTDFCNMVRDEQQKSVTQDDLAQFMLGFDRAIARILFSFLPQRVRMAYLTSNFVMVSCGVRSDDAVLVQVCSLCHEKTEGGTAYFSPHRPTIQTDFGPKVVAFSNHALERTRERTVRNPFDYDGNIHSVGFIVSCDYFEPCEIPRSDYAFTFYNDCYMRGSVFHEYAEAVLNSMDVDKHYYYRVGYCPAVIAGDLLVAKTLLLPGMNGTPEYQQVARKLAGSQDAKLAFRKRVNALSLDNLLTNRDFSLIKEFHEAGIPQVVSFNHDIFRLDAIEKAWRRDTESRRDATRAKET